MGGNRFHRIYTSLWVAWLGSVHIEGPQRTGPGGNVPIYEYRCPDCGHEFEQLQRMSDDPITDCPECSMSGVKKLISRTSFVLKGGGWYKDHYGLKGSSSDSSSTKASSSTKTSTSSSSDS